MARPGRLGRLARLLAATMLPSAPATAQEQQGVKAWITLEHDAQGNSRFVGHASATEAIEVRFELVGERRGGGGVSHVMQGGTVQLVPGRPATLSQLSFGDLALIPNYAVNLRLFRGQQLLTSAEINKMQNSGIN